MAIGSTRFILGSYLVYPWLPAKGLRAKCKAKGNLGGGIIRLSPSRAFQDWTFFVILGFILRRSRRNLIRESTSSYSCHNGTRGMPWRTEAGPIIMLNGKTQNNCLRCCHSKNCVRSYLQGSIARYLILVCIVPLKN